MIPDFVINKTTLLKVFESAVDLVSCLWIYVHDTYIVIRGNANNISVGACIDLEKLLNKKLIGKCIGGLDTQYTLQILKSFSSQIIGCVIDNGQFRFWSDRNDFYNI